MATARKETRMTRYIQIAILASAMLTTATLDPRAESRSVAGPDALARELRDAWLPLESALAVSTREGTPLSGKYEIDNGTFQLSVYTLKASTSASDTFTEVIVDYNAGIVLKAEVITEGGDRTAAEAQKTAMARAKRPLAEAITD